MNGDVVQQEYEADYERSRRKDSLLDSAGVHLVQDRSGSYVFSLDSAGREIFLLRREPSSNFWSVGHEQVGGDTDSGSDNAFDQEDLLPGVNFADAVEFQDAARK